MITILVAEDNALIQMATKMIFKAFDCRVDFAKAGKETLDLLEKNSYDVVLLDLGLPDIDGLALAKKIRQNKTFNKIPLIALTAQGSKDCKEQCLASGMSAFYTKPLTKENIAEILEAFT